MKLKPLSTALALSLVSLVSQAADLGLMPAAATFANTVDGTQGSRTIPYSVLQKEPQAAAAVTSSVPADASKSSANAFSGDAELKLVSEPESYAVLLAGLGVVGFLARRRRSD